MAGADQNRPSWWACGSERAHAGCVLATYTRACNRNAGPQGAGHVCSVPFPEWIITSVTPLLRTKEYGLESRIHEEIQGQETEDAQFCPPKPEPVSGRRCEVLFFGGCVPLEFLLHTTGIYTCCLNKL